MKRSVRCITKYFVIIVLTSFVTTVVFHIVRFMQHRDSIFSDVLLLPNISRRRGKSDSTGIIDWHDNKQISLDKSRTGVGEQGKPATLPEDYDKNKFDELYNTNGFNALLSDYISVNRSVPDIRHPGCKTEKYRAELPTVSVVIPFHNEHWSTLLRTVYSVINRSPPQLLKEIILVDDSSSKAHSKEPLDVYVHKHLKKVVTVIHLAKREGLIRARLTGARLATGDVLIFLDSHSEANVNWLPPLLDPIAENYKTCVCPFIDVIAYDTFEYRAQDEGARGAFDWEMYYKRLPLLPEDKKFPTRPFKSPVMAGGLFAISAKFFWELGGYDPGLDIWGGEQYELSFKIWQCGGRMLDAPCSRVGHIYRKFAPFPNPGIGDFVGKNYRRVAEVWMDEYKEYLYMRRPHYRSIKPGDLSAQLEIRKNLKCKSFKWFMTNIAFDLPKKYPPVEPPHFARGRVRNNVAKEYCVTYMDKAQDHLFLTECKRKLSKGKIHQRFEMTWRRDIRVEGTTLCWDVSDLALKAEVNMFGCHGSQGNQLWKYDMEKNWLVHGGNPRCLDCDLSKKQVYVTKCDENSESQKWLLDNIDEGAVEKWDWEDSL